MGVFRDLFGSSFRSTSHEIYGMRNGSLIVPLDLCIMQIDLNNIARFAPPATSSDLVGAKLKLTSGATIGTIKTYHWPPTVPQSSNVNPVITVQLATNVNISGGTLPNAVAPAVSVNDPVSLKIDGVGIPGKVITTIQQYPYPIPQFEVQAYRVDFDQTLHDRAHGARVELDTGGLLGMLIATQNVNGKCQALVYPAHMI